MAEKIIRPKFRTIPVAYKVIRDPKLVGLGMWCKFFDEIGLAPPTPDQGGSYGNLCVRHQENQFFVTLSGHSLRNASNYDQFALVTGVDLEERTISAVLPRKGVEPSSESYLYYMVLDADPEVNAGFHGHCKLMTQYEDILPTKFNIPVTEIQREYGTIELAQDVLKAHGTHNLIQAKGHGIFSFGPNMGAAGRAADIANTLVRNYHESLANDSTPSSLLPLM
ncbi:MAG: class II aldolase/adducin family protein [archaeon]